MQRKIIEIDPSKPQKGKDQLLLNQLLKDFQKSDKKELSKKLTHTVELNDQSHEIKLKHSISKPFESPESNPSNEFYVRTKEKLGEGAFGSVKRASHRLIMHDNKVSVLPGVMVYKRMQPQKNESNTSFKSRVNEEIAAINKRYPGINVQVIEKNQSVHFFVPFIPGKCLTQEELVFNKKYYYIATRSMDINKKLSYARQFFRDLAFIHNNKKIVHMDIKSDNVMITDHGQLRNIDFGLAKKHGESISVGIGTPGYVAPEVAKASRLKPLALTGKEDMYSSAVVFYEIITGKDAQESDIYETPPNRHNPYPKFKLNKEQFQKSDKVLQPIFLDIFSNLTNRDEPQKRMSAHHAEMLMGIISSELFHDIKNKKDIADKKISNYSLQDLFYLNACSSEITNQEFNDALNLIFDETEKNKFENVLNNNKQIFTHLLNSKIKSQFNKLLNEISKDRGEKNKNNEKSEAINQLANLVNKDNLDLNELTKQIEKILELAVNAQSHKKAGSAVIRKIFDNLDPFILEQISPAILEKAHELKAGTVVSHVKAYAKMFSGKTEKKSSEVETSSPKSGIDLP